MTVGFALQTVVEIAIACLLIWGFVREKKIAAFERQLRRFLVYKIDQRQKRKASETQKKPAVKPAQQPIRYEGPKLVKPAAASHHAA